MGYQFYTPHPPAPEYPVRSKCFLCGRFGTGGKHTRTRACGSCDVMWEVLPAGQEEPGYSFESGHLRIIRGLADRRVRFYMNPVAPYADLFDDFIDHGAVTIPTPA